MQRTLCYAALASVVTLAAAVCNEHDCTTDADCTTCAYVDTTDYAFAQFKYRCMLNITESGGNECRIDESVKFSTAYINAVRSCHLVPGKKCCEPGKKHDEQMRSCARRSCRRAIGCSIGGGCQYDDVNMAHGSAVDCCDVDSDCPPFAPPAFWDSSLATSLSRICERPRCDLNTRSCVYERTPDCCAADTPDCDKYTVASSRCSVGACVYDSAVASTLQLNPFADMDTAHSIATQLLDKSPHVVSASYNALVSPLKCEARVKADCDCTSDADCVQYANECAVAECVLDVDTERHTCRTKPAANAPSHCCTGNADGSPLSEAQLVAQCTDMDSDACLVPVSCDTHGTVLHDDGSSSGAPGNRLSPRGDLLLATFRCSYVRRTGTAECCAYADDCAELASLNECVLDKCGPPSIGERSRCSLSKSGYKFMDRKLPCCYTTDDCYKARGQSQLEYLAEVSAEPDGSCVLVECSGDSPDVAPSMRHKCVPRMHPRCPTIATEMRLGARTASGAALFAGRLAAQQLALTAPSAQFNDEQLPLTASIVESACDGLLVVRLHAQLSRLDAAHFSAPRRVTFFDAPGWSNPDFMLPTAYYHFYYAAKTSVVLQSDTVEYVRLSAQSMQASVWSAHTSRDVFESVVIEDDEKIASLDMTLEVSFNATRLVDFPSHAQRLFSSSRTNLTIEWEDGSRTVLRVNYFNANDALAACSRSQYVSRESIDYMAQTIDGFLPDVDLGSPTIFGPFVFDESKVDVVRKNRIRETTEERLKQMQEADIRAMSSMKLRARTETAPIEHEIQAVVNFTRMNTQFTGASVTLSSTYDNRHDVIVCGGNLAIVYDRINNRRVFVRPGSTDIDFPFGNLAPGTNVPSQLAIPVFKKCSMYSRNGFILTETFRLTTTTSSFEYWVHIKKYNYDPTSSTLTPGSNVLYDVNAFPVFSGIFNYTDPINDCQARVLSTNEVDPTVASVRVDSEAWPYEPSLSANRITTLSSSYNCKSIPSGNITIADLKSTGITISFTNSTGVLVDLCFAWVFDPSYVSYDLNAKRPHKLVPIYTDGEGMNPGPDNLPGTPRARVFTCIENNAVGTYNVPITCLDFTCEPNHVPASTTPGVSMFAIPTGNTQEFIFNSSFYVNRDCVSFYNLIAVNSFSLASIQVNLFSVFYDDASNKLFHGSPQQANSRPLYPMNLLTFPSGTTCKHLKTTSIGKRVGGTTWIAAVMVPDSTSTFIYVFGFDPIRATQTPEHYTTLDIGVQTRYVVGVDIDYIVHLEQASYVSYGADDFDTIITVQVNGGSILRSKVFKYTFDQNTLGVDLAATCGKDTQIYCDAFSNKECLTSATSNLMSGYCVPGHPRKCSPDGTLFDMTSVSTDPSGNNDLLLRNATDLEETPILYTDSFCWAEPSQCVAVTQTIGEPCQCACGCIKIVTRGIGTDFSVYYSNCLNGSPYNETAAEFQEYNFTFLDDGPPTPQPTFGNNTVPTYAPTPHPTVPAPTPVTCGIPLSYCINLHCSHYTSYCNTSTSFCTDGCRPDSLDACNVDADCAFRDCCGCDTLLSFGRIECDPFPPSSMPSLPTPQPTVVPGAPSPAPTPPVPTFLPAPPTPMPTPIPGAGEVDLTARGGSRSGCANHIEGSYNVPFDGAWSGPVPASVGYSDNVPDTRITVLRIANSCTGCPLDFTNSQCSKRCLKSGGTAYSYSVHFEVSNNDADARNIIPEHSQCSAPDSFVMLINVTGCNHHLPPPVNYTKPLYPRHHCTAITPVHSSVYISPASLTSVIEPGVSVHGQPGYDHSFFVLRGNCLPTGATIMFDMRVEGCTEVPQSVPREISCFDVTARLATGKCAALLSNWASCAPNEFGIYRSATRVAYPYDYRQCIHRERHLMSQTQLPGFTQFGDCANTCPEAYLNPQSADALVHAHDAAFDDHHHSHESFQFGPHKTFVEPSHEYKNAHNWPKTPDEAAARLTEVGSSSVGVHAFDEQLSSVRNSARLSVRALNVSSQPFGAHTAAVPAVSSDTEAGPVVSIEAAIGTLWQPDVAACFVDTSGYVAESSDVNAELFAHSDCIDVYNETHADRQLTTIRRTCGEAGRTPRVIRIDTHIKHYSDEAGYAPAASPTSAVSGRVRIDFGRYHPQLASPHVDDEPLCSPLRLLYNFSTTAPAGLDSVVPSRLRRAASYVSFRGDNKWHSEPSPTQGDFNAQRPYWHSHRASVAPDVYSAQDSIISSSSPWPELGFDRVDSLEIEYDFQALLPGQSIKLSLYYAACDLNTQVPWLSTRVTLLQSSVRSIDCSIPGARQPRCEDRRVFAADLSDVETTTNFECYELAAASSYWGVRREGMSKWLPAYIALSVAGVVALTLIVAIVCFAWSKRLASAKVL